MISVLITFKSLLTKIYSLPFSEKSNRRFYLTGQIAIHKFINKISHSTMGQIFNTEIKN